MEQWQASLYAKRGKWTCTQPCKICIRVGRCGEALAAAPRANFQAVLRGPEFQQASPVKGWKGARARRASFELLTDGSPRSTAKSSFAARNSPGRKHRSRRPPRKTFAEPVARSAPVRVRQLSSFPFEPSFRASALPRIRRAPGLPDPRVLLQDCKPAPGCVPRGRLFKGDPCVPKG